MTAGIAANKPMAVATSASAIPGATMASVTCCTFPIEVNAFMIPHTVPNNPTYGPVDLPQLRDPHRAPRAFQKLIRRRDALLALARKFPKAEFEDARHAGGATPLLERAIKLCEIPTGPEAALELVGFDPCAPDHTA